MSDERVTTATGRLVAARASQDAERAAAALDRLGDAADELAAPGRRDRRPRPGRDATLADLADRVDGPRRAARRARRRRGHRDAAARGARRQLGARRPPAAAPRALARAHRPDARLDPSRRRTRCAADLLRAVGADPADAVPVATGADAEARGRAAGGATAGCCSGSPPATSPHDVGVDDVAAELSDLAAGTLDAALAIARARVGDGRRGCPARGDRDGQVRRPRAQLRQRRRRDLRGRAGRRAPTSSAALRAATQLASHLMRVCSDHTARGHDLAGRRGPAPRGQVRPAGPHARQPRGLLRALGQDLGVPGAAQGPAGRRRPRARPGVPASAIAPMVWSAAERDGFVDRRAGDAPPGRRPHPGRRRPSGSSSSAPAGCATSSSPSSCCSSCTAAPTSRCAAPTTLSRAGAPHRAAGTSAARTAPRSTTAYRFLRTLEHRHPAVPAAPHPRACPRTRRRCAGSAARWG